MSIVSHTDAAARAPMMLPARARPFVGPGVTILGLGAIELLRYAEQLSALPVAMILVWSGLFGTAAGTGAMAAAPLLAIVLGHYTIALVPLISATPGGQLYLLVNAAVVLAGSGAWYLRSGRPASPPADPEPQDPQQARRSQLLADASALFDLSLGAQGTIQHASRLAVPLLGDWCAIYIVGEDGVARRQTVAHDNPALEELLEHALESAPLRPAEPHPLADVHEVIRTGDPLIKSVGVPAGFMAFARIPADREVMHALEPRALMMVPLVSQGERLGALVFARTTDAAPFQLDELALATSFCERIGLALVNAQLLEQAISVRSDAVLARDRMAGMLEGISNGFILLDTQSTVTYLNREAERMLSLRREQLLGRELWSVIRMNEATSSLIGACRSVRKSERPVTVEILQSWSGEPRWTEIQLFPLESGVSMCLRDVTVSRRLQDELKMRESELERSQRMESIGRLAGGVAHDFNNILMSIGGYTELLASKLKDNDEVLDDLAEVRKSTERAASLTRQLLMYSRRQANQPRVIDLGAVLTDLEKMLVRLLGEDILLAVRTGDNVPPVLVDRSQMEQVVLNLAVNARDAMPDGGQLFIDLALGGRGAGGIEGETVVLTVSDTGTGIESASLPLIFEPFFTTKETGTGLGLASVYGIVQQNGGKITVKSTVGRGTTFRIHFPVAPASAIADTVEPPPLAIAAPPVADASVKRERVTPRKRKAATAEPAPTDSGVILVAEDEESVRKYICTVLRDAGYTVLDGRNGVEALATAARHEGPLDLLITDLIMPEMGGKQLAERLIAERPGVHVLFTSGYADDIQSLDKEIKAGAILIHKPFSSEFLLERVRHLLSAAPTTRGESGRASPFGSRKTKP